MTARCCVYALLIFTPLARGAFQDWSVQIIHILTLTALTAVLMGRRNMDFYRRRKTLLDIPLFLLLCLVGISSLFSIHRGTSFWSSLLFFDYCIIFYVAVHLFRSRSQVRFLVYLITGTGVFLALFGFIKLLGHNPFPWWDYQDIRQSEFRLSSTFGNANHLAGYLEMVLMITLAWLMTGLRAGKRFFWIYLSVVIGSALLLSLARGGWISTITGLAIMNLILIKERILEAKKVIGVTSVFFFTAATIILFHTPVVERIRTFEKQDKIPSFYIGAVLFQEGLDGLHGHIGRSRFHIRENRGGPQLFKNIGRTGPGHGRHDGLVSRADTQCLGDQKQCGGAGMKRDGVLHPVNPDHFGFEFLDFGTDADPAAF